MFQADVREVMSESQVAARGRIKFICRSDDPLAHDGPSVIQNLMGSPRKISSVYVYDRRGTELFERQCLTPEYYLRRAEAALLHAHAGEIVRLCGTLPIVELGAGTADKTQTLLAMYQALGAPCEYFAIDVDVETLAESAYRLASIYPDLAVNCLGATYEQGLRALPTSATARLFLFLGSSIGNMEWVEIEEFLRSLYQGLAPNDYLLIGADLDKEPAVIDRAYNDAAGYGAQSTLNMLAHLNHRFRGDFVLENFAYRSAYNPRLRRNEVHIESLVAQCVTLGALDFSVSLRAGERIEAELMWKFEPKEFESLLARAGFLMERHWIEQRCAYGLFLMRRQ